MALRLTPVVWLFPIQRQLAAPGPAGQPPGPNTARLQAHCSGGHLARTTLALCSCPRRHRRRRLRTAGTPGDIAPPFS